MNDEFDTIGYEDMANLALPEHKVTTNYMDNKSIH